MKFPISCLPVNPPTCQKAEWSQVQLLNSHFVFQHNLRRLSNMKRLGGCWTIQKMDGWVDLGWSGCSLTFRKILAPDTRERERDPRQYWQGGDLGRHSRQSFSSGLDSSAFAFCGIRCQTPNFSVAPVPVPLVIIFIELEAKWQSLKLGKSDLPLRCWDCFCYTRHSCSRYHSHTWHQYIKFWKFTNLSWSTYNLPSCCKVVFYSCHHTHCSHHCNHRCSHCSCQCNHHNGQNSHYHIHCSP